MLAESTARRFWSSAPNSLAACCCWLLVAGNPPVCPAAHAAGNDPYPAEGTPGCPSQSSPQCPSACGAGFPGSFASDKYTFTGGIQMAQGEAAIQQMIMAGGPVETAFTVYSDFENYAGGELRWLVGRRDL